MKKLSTDNPIFEFMGNVGDWIILNILFVLTSSYHNWDVIDCHI